MAKNVSMTRERKIALPVILSAAEGMLKMLDPRTDQHKRLDKALGAFRDH